MTAVRFLARFTNTSVPTTNYALCDFDFNPLVGTTLPELGAQIIGYLQQCDVFAEATHLVDLSYRNAGAAGFTPLPFPVAEYAAVDAAAVVDGFTSAPMTTYATRLAGTGVLLPLGTSISVSERTAHAGPTGRGRHFLPFIAASVNNGVGQVASLYLSAIENAYNEFFLGIKPGGGAATQPVPDPVIVVTNAAGTTQYPIVSCKPQAIFSNLESRRR